MLNPRVRGRRSVRRMGSSVDAAVLYCTPVNLMSFRFHVPKRNYWPLCCFGGLVCLDRGVYYVGCGQRRGVDWRFGRVLGQLVLRTTAAFFLSCWFTMLARGLTNCLCSRCS